MQHLLVTETPKKTSGGVVSSCSFTLAQLLNSYNNKKTVLLTEREKKVNFLSCLCEEELENLSPNSFKNQMTKKKGQCFYAIKFSWFWGGLTHGFSKELALMVMG